MNRLVDIPFHSPNRPENPLNASDPILYVNISRMDRRDWLDPEELQDVTSHNDHVPQSKGYIIPLSNLRPFPIQKGHVGVVKDTTLLLRSLSPTGAHRRTTIGVPFLGSSAI